MTETMLKAVAFSILCGILAYMLFVVAMFVVAVIQIAIFIFIVMSGGWGIG